jgi:septum site-determining protein MinD
VDKDNADIVTKKMEKVLGVRVIGIIPEDSNVRKASSAKTPIVIKYPTSPASIAIRRIASDLIGIAFKEEAVPEKKPGFLDRFSNALFKKKSA